MKKIFTLIAMAIMAVGANAQSVVYHWSSEGADAVTETGGTIVFKDGDGGANRLNYANTAQDVTYYTICLNGKVGNIGDADGNAACGYMELTLNNPLASGDIIAVTAYTNKGDESKLGTPGFVFEDGTKLVNDDLTYPDLGVTTNTAPAKQEYTIPAEAVGTKVIKMARSKASTNLFITKLEILSNTTGINTVKTVADNGEAYNLAGQKVNKNFKGVVIQNGKKVVIK